MEMTRARWGPHPPRHTYCGRRGCSYVTTSGLRTTPAAPQKLATIAKMEMALSRNQGKRKTEDTPCRLKRYLANRERGLSVGSCPCGPKQHCRQSSLDATPVKSMISKTTCLATAHLTTRHTANKRQSKSKGGALRPPLIISAKSLAPISSTPRARTARPTGGRKLAVADEGHLHLFGFYPRGVIKWRRDCAPAVNPSSWLLSRQGTNLMSTLFLGPS